MPLQDPLMPGEPGPFYTPSEPQYDHWDESEIIIDPVSGFVTVIPPHSGPGRFQPARRGSSSSSPWRQMLTRWLRRLGATTGLILIAAISAHAEQTLLNVSCDPTRELYADYNRFFAERDGNMTSSRQQAAKGRGNSARGKG